MNAKADRHERVVAECPNCGHKDVYKSGRALTFMEAQLTCKGCGLVFWVRPDMMVVVPKGVLAVVETEDG